MDKPIKYSYRVQYEEHKDNSTPWMRPKPRFWVERQSFIGSVLDGEWDKVGVDKVHEGYDVDFGGYYELPYVETTYYDTSEDAIARIHELLDAYPQELAAWEKWESERSMREAAEADRLKAEKAAKDKFERKNQIGRIFE